jgi:hypothetical protein
MAKNQITLSQAIEGYFLAATATGPEKKTLAAATRMGAGGT